MKQRKTKLHYDKRVECGPCRIVDILCGTPAFVFDEAAIRRKIDQLVNSCAELHLLYSMKACSVTPILRLIAGSVRGFAVSSTFEAILAREILGDTSRVFWTTPYLSEAVPEHFGRYASHLVFNSLEQMARIESLMGPSVERGIRVNPRLSFIDDARYDPCRKNSKLGVPIEETLLAWRKGDLQSISGIHFHTACESSSWEPLLQTVKAIEERLAPMMSGLDWINLGGGYQWHDGSDFSPLQEAVDLLRDKYGLEVHIEPGHGIVNSAGLLFSSVVDLFESEDKTIAILDTAVNHLPEVFEFQYEPDVAEHVDGAQHEYILAGCSCLAGDVFGEYAFEEPLNIGSCITFKNVGAYNLEKANMFNGINQPSIFILREDGELELVRQFTYEDYLARCGGEINATVRARV